MAKILLDEVGKTVQNNLAKIMEVTLPHGPGTMRVAAGRQRKSTMKG